MKINKWVYTLDEIFDFVKENFNDYTIFVHDQLCIRDDGEYVCGTWLTTMQDRDEETRDKMKNLYYTEKYLLTDIDIKSKWITFNKIKE